jgi:predicted dehydrogenase
MEEFLRLLVSHVVEVEPLIEATYPIERVSEAFARLAEPERPLAIRLSYDSVSQVCESSAASRKIVIRATPSRIADGRIRVGIIGAGAYARNVHLPNLKRLGDRFDLIAICNRTGSGAKSAASETDAAFATTDPADILSDASIDLVMICTRHDLHGGLVLDSLHAGKHTFVEKPLCTTHDELRAIKAFYETADKSPGDTGRPILMVGFNRRFSRYAREAKRHLEARINPLFIHYRMNAGYVPPDHWVHGSEGGGRIIGEACHIIDLFSYLVGAPVRSVTSSSLRPKTSSVRADDNRVILLDYEDGSVAVLEYFTIGSKDYPKECLEIHFDERTIVVDDYKSIDGYGVGVQEIRSKQSEKGQFEELVAVAEILRSGKGELPIPLESLFETTAVTIAAQHDHLTVMPT